jgi:hypothetical protein
VLPVTCCGLPVLPVLIAAGALGGLGALLHIPWLLTTAAVLLVGGAVWLRRRRTVEQGNCCPRDDSIPGTSARPTIDVPHHHKDAHDDRDSSDAG